MVTHSGTPYHRSCRCYRLKTGLGYYDFVKAAATVSYIHPGNKLAAIVGFNEKLDHQVAREVAAQVAAMNPISVRPEEVLQHILLMRKSRLLRRSIGSWQTGEHARSYRSGFYPEIL